MKRLLALLCLPIAFATLAVGTGVVSAQFDPFEQVDCSQTNADGQQSPVCDKTTTNPITGSDGIITTIANIFAFITGIAAVVVIIISGFEYVRSGGDSAKINKAKNGILFAVIGLVVVAIARGIVALVVSRV